MKKFVTAVLSVLLVASMATAALADNFVSSVFVPSVTFVSSVQVSGATASGVTYTDAQGTTHDVAVITDGSALDAAVPALRITMVASSLDSTKANGLTAEQNAFAVNVFNGMSEAGSLAAYLSGLKGFEGDLTGYVASAMFTVEASDALIALLGDQKMEVTIQVPGVEEGTQVAVAILTAGENGEVEYNAAAATATKAGVETTVNPFGVMVVAVK